MNGLRTEPCPLTCVHRACLSACLCRTCQPSVPTSATSRTTTCPGCAAPCLSTAPTCTRSPCFLPVVFPMDRWTWSCQRSSTSRMMRTRRPSSVPRLNGAAVWRRFLRASAFLRSPGSHAQVILAHPEACLMPLNASAHLVASATLRCSSRPPCRLVLRPQVRAGSSPSSPSRSRPEPMVCSSAALPSLPCLRMECRCSQTWSPWSSGAAHFSCAPSIMTGNGPTFSSWSSP